MWILKQQFTWNENWLWIYEWKFAPFDKWLRTFERNFSLYLLCSNIPMHFLDNNCLVWICRDDSFLMSLHIVSFATNLCPFIQQVYTRLTCITSKVPCTLVQSFMSRESVASNFAISNFPLLPRKFATSNFQERSWIFRFKPYEKSFQKSTTFHGKLARTKDDFRWISFALLLHNTVYVSKAVVFALYEAEIARWIYPVLGAYPFVRGHIIRLLNGLKVGSPGRAHMLWILPSSYKIHLTVK